MRRIRSPYLLVEGGGSHTIAVLHDGLTVRAKSEGPTSNPESVGTDDAYRNLCSVFEAATASFSGSFDVFAAHGSASTRSRASLLAHQIRKALSAYEVKNVTAVNDLVPLACLHPSEDVVVCAAGTGTGYLARSKGGHWARSSGLEYVMSDEGGGYWIGQEILRAVVRSIDGRGPSTILSGLIESRLGVQLGVSASEHLMSWLHSDGRSLKYRVASLADMAFEGLTYGDQASAKIVDRAIKEYCLGITSVATRAGIDANNMRLLLTGTIIAENPHLATRIVNNCDMQNARATILPTGELSSLFLWVETWEGLIPEESPPADLPIFTESVMKAIL